MKKYISLLLSLLIASIVSTSVVSCSSDEPDEPGPTIINGIDVSLIPGVYEFSGNIAPSFELRKDGTCTIKSNSSSGGNSEDKWSYNSATCTLIVGTHVYAVKSLTEDALAAEWTSVKYGVSLASWKRYVYDPKKIELSLSETEMVIGEVMKLEATFSPSNVINNRVIWSSSDESVASVNNSGTVTAKAEGNATITCSSESDKSVKATCKISVGRIKVTGINISNISPKFWVGSGMRLKPNIFPTNATNNSVTWQSSDNTVATVDEYGLVTGLAEGKVTITCTSEDNSNIKATCDINVLSLTGTINGHEYVDLGLPSGTLWATMNIGATSAENCGDSFAWGETKSKSNYKWSNYKWCNGSSTSLTKYCKSSDYGTVDNKVTLDIEDDVAHVNWGGDWRMPTISELSELVSFCNWYWTNQNGVEGYMFSSKANSTRIFLPFYDENTKNTAALGIMRAYWSSSIYYRESSVGVFGGYIDDHASSLWNSNDEKKPHTNGGSNRYYGSLVRAVCSRNK